MPIYDPNTAINGSITGPVAYDQDKGTDVTSIAVIIIVCLSAAFCLSVAVTQAILVFKKARKDKVSIARATAAQMRENATPCMQMGLNAGAAAMRAAACANQAGSAAVQAGSAAVVAADAINVRVRGETSTGRDAAPAVAHAVDSF